MIWYFSDQVKDRAKMKRDKDDICYVEAKYRCIQVGTYYNGLSLHNFITLLNLSHSGHND
jgi:hypothetical protein